MSNEQKAKMHDLIRASVCDIVRSEKVQHLIDDGIFKSVDDHRDIQRDAGDILSHICTARCKARVDNNGTPDDLQYRKKDNLKISPDNTKIVMLVYPINIHLNAS